jgi:hypothetical protein
MMQPRASIFGGSWLNGDNAGSRYANLDYWPENSNDNLGARGRSDDGLINGKASRTSLDDALQTDARRRSRSRRRTMRDQGLWSARVSCFGEYIARSGRAGRRRRVLWQSVADFAANGGRARRRVAGNSLSRPAAGFFIDRGTAAR